MPAQSGDARLLHPTSKLKIKIFVDRLCVVLRDLPFSKNHPMTIPQEF
jgi:hypothetical protein